MNSKLLQTALLIGLIFTVSLSMFGFESKCQNIRENVLRLHILANSDSDEDQALKLKVRDRIIKESGEIFESTRSEKEAATAAIKALPRLNEIAADEIALQGYDYPVSIDVGMADFGTREYNEVTLPAGRYEAVRVIIGSGEGKNWWCVMFPAMCLPAASETRELSEVLEDEALDIVENSEKYEFRFKTVEIFESLKQSFEKLTKG